MTAAQDLRVLLDHAPDAIGRFDRDLRHVYVNEATARANNRPASDFEGKTMEDLGHTPEVCELINSNLRAVFDEGVERTVELLFDGPHGPVWFESRMAPEFASDGSVQYVLVISRDISEHRRMAAQLGESAKRAALVEQSAQLAHEIHNPLYAVTNAVYLLQQNPSLNDDARQMVQLAAQELQRVSEISQRLLLFSEIAQPDLSRDGQTEHTSAEAAVQGKR